MGLTAPRRDHRVLTATVHDRTVAVLGSHWHDDLPPARYGCEQRPRRPFTAAWQSRYRMVGLQSQLMVRAGPPGRGCRDYRDYRHGASHCQGDWNHWPG